MGNKKFCLKTKIQIIKTKIKNREEKRKYTMISKELAQVLKNFFLVLDGLDPCWCDYGPNRHTMCGNCVRKIK